MSRYINTSGRDLTIYADSGFTVAVGKLYRDSVCYCLGEQGNAVVVMYKISSDGNGKAKVGFTDYMEGIQQE